VQGGNCRGYGRLLLQVPRPAWKNLLLLLPCTAADTKLAFTCLAAGGLLRCSFGPVCELLVAAPGLVTALTHLLLQPFPQSLGAWTGPWRWAVTLHQGAEPGKELPYGVVNEPSPPGPWSATAQVEKTNTYRFS